MLLFFLQGPQGPPGSPGNQGHTGPPVIKHTIKDTIILKHINLFWQHINAC